MLGAPWSILPLWVSLNLGYRYYAHHLHQKTWPIFRDEEYMARQPRLRIEAELDLSQREHAERWASLRYHLQLTEVDVPVPPGAVDAAALDEVARRFEEARG